MREGKRLRAAVLGLAATTLVAVSSPVLAQTTATGQNPSDRIPAAVSPQAPLDMAAPGSCPFASPGLTVTLTRVTVEGATVVDQGAIDAAVAPLLGSQTGLEVVCAARDRVADLFASRGYRLTRIDVPPQRLSSGELRLVATEGYVASADVDGLEPMGPSAAVARNYFTNIGTERPTPWSRIERAVFLAREIPGAEMAIRLNAAPDGPGAVRLTASAAGRRRFDITTGLQHMGSEELGETAAFVRFDANSFTSLAERTSLLLYATENGAQQVVELIESVAIGSQGLRAEVDLTYARTQPEGVLAPLMIEGDFFSIRAGAIYPFVRSQALSVNFGAHVEYLDQENSLGVFQSLPGGAPVLFDDKLRIIRVEADTRWRPDRWRSFEGWANGQIRKGIGGGSSRGDPNLSRAEGDPEATVIRAEATGRWTFGGRPASGGFAGPWMSASVSGQWASDPLLAYEEFQIGNFTVGRGYDPGSASGDEAWAVQLEAGWPVDTPAGKIEPYVFYDYADLNNLDQSGYQTQISSYGVGVRARLPWKLRLDVAWASPQDPPFPSAPQPDDRLLVSLTRVFSFR